MHIIDAPIPGVVLMDLEPHKDERGWFARATCADEIGRAGLDPRVHQTSLSFNAQRGTLRGLHWQADPFGETKIVRVLTGAIADVVVDVRPDSRTYLKHMQLELDGPGRAILLPPGVAHGFQTLTDNALVLYQMSVPYREDAARGLRWDDPRLDIDWPIPSPILSERDSAWPLLPEEAFHAA